MGEDLLCAVTGSALEALAEGDEALDAPWRQYASVGGSSVKVLLPRTTM